MILQQGVERVAVLEIAPKQTLVYVDSGLKDPTFAAWSVTGPQLALGSGSGGVAMFRRDTRKRLPIAGKHTGSITCGAWSQDGRLALGSSDCTLTVSNSDGDEVESGGRFTDCGSPPLEIQWGSCLQESTEEGVLGAVGAAASTAVHQPSTSLSRLSQPSAAVNINGRSILLYTPGDPRGTTELQFQPHYGRITGYRWIEGGYMALGFRCGQTDVRAQLTEEIFTPHIHSLVTHFLFHFLHTFFFNCALKFLAILSEGFITVVSTHPLELGEEVFCSGRMLADPLEDVAVNYVAGRLAVAGGGAVRFISTTTWGEVPGEGVTLEPSLGAIDSLTWTRDGAILTLVTRGGSVLSYLTRGPPVALSARCIKQACRKAKAPHNSHTHTHTHTHTFPPSPQWSLCAPHLSQRANHYPPHPPWGKRCRGT